MASEEENQEGLSLPKKVAVGVAAGVATTAASAVAKKLMAGGDEDGDEDGGAPAVGDRGRGAGRGGHGARFGPRITRSTGPGLPVEPGDRPVRAGTTPGTGHLPVGHTCPL